jgi:ElaB/YqjD/DUF883 family membrane-anchored ribosome-binding protein
MNTTTKNQGGNQGTSQAQNEANKAMDKGREAAGHATEAARDAASSVGQAASNLASSVGQKASDAAHNVGQRASDAAHNVGQRAEDATSAVGSGISHLAGQVRDSAPQSGMLGTAGRQVADTMDSVGHYVSDKNLTGMMDDVTGLVRRNPIPALLIGLGVGFLIGRVLSSSRS